MVADSEDLFKNLSSIPDGWPKWHRERVSLEYRPVWYPGGRAKMRHMFRECATERLFIPEMFTNEDALIYIDTDFIFMRPPEDLWAKFYEFNEHQVAAMAPCLYHYGTNENNKVSCMFQILETVS